MPHKRGIGTGSVRDVCMKGANGFHADISRGGCECMMIRMNVDNLEDAIEFPEIQGFHKSRHDAAKETIDT